MTDHTDFELMWLYANMCISELADKYEECRHGERQMPEEADPGQAAEPMAQGIRVLKVKPGMAPEIETISHTLESLQAAVGGYIEALELDCGVCLICNENGKFLGLPANRQVCGDMIAGTFLIVGEADGEFCSLTDVDAKYYAKEFAQPAQSYRGPDDSVSWEFHVL